MAASWSRRAPTQAQLCLLYVCVCVSVCWGSSSCLHTDRVAECTEQLSLLCCPRCHSLSPPISSPSLPHWLICQSLATVASFPLYPFFSHHPLLSLSSRSVAPNDPSPAFLPLALPCSTSSVFLPLFLSSAAPVFICVNGWDAFVDRFHSDGPMEEVVIHVRLL